MVFYKNPDDFINVELLKNCLLKINSVKERRIIEEAAVVNVL